MRGRGLCSPKDGQSRVSWDPQEVSLASEKVVLRVCSAERRGGKRWQVPLTGALGGAGEWEGTRFVDKTAENSPQLKKDRSPRIKSVFHVPDRISKNKSTSRLS